MKKGFLCILSKDYGPSINLYIKMLHNLLSFWKKASDVELNSGSNLQTTCGSITGITDSLTSTSSTVCASSNAVKQLNDKLTALQS